MEKLKKERNAAKNIETRKKIQAYGMIWPDVQHCSAIARFWFFLEFLVADGSSVVALIQFT